MASGDNYGLPELFTSENVTRIRYVNGEPQCATYDISKDVIYWWRPEDLEVRVVPLKHARRQDALFPILRILPRRGAEPLAEVTAQDFGPPLRRQL